MNVFRRCFSSKAWNLGSEQRALVGNRTLIITKNDKESKDLAQKMWFRLQAQGIQSSFITMGMHYPVYKEIKEAVQIITRTASNSLITIGDSSVTDFGKLTRRVYASGSIDESQLIFSSPNNGIDIPLLSILQTPSVNHYLSRAMMIHKEEDILVGIPTKTPTLTIFEEGACSELKHTNPNISKSYLLSSIFDLFFTMGLHSEDKAGIQSLKSEINLNSVERVQQDKNAKAIARLREQIVNKYDIRSDLWPGMIENLSNLLSMNAISSYSYPFSYYSMFVLDHLLTKKLYKNHDISDEIEEKMIKALKFASHGTAELLKASDSVSLSNSMKDIHEALLPGLQDVKSLRKQKSNLFLKKIKPSTEDLSKNGFEGGDIEKMLVLFETEKESENGLTPAGKLKEGMLDSDLFQEIFEDVRHLENIK